MPLERIEYRGCNIDRDSHTINKHNPVSGHRWSESVPLKTFWVSGPGIRSRGGFRSIESAQAHIDFALLTPIVAT